FPPARRLEVFAGPCGALIVNGAECEPYISCDDMLMREASAGIVAGVLEMADLVGAPRAIIAIERDKPRALEAMRNAVIEAGDPRLANCESPTVYPAGGERPPIVPLSGDDVSYGDMSVSAAVVAH